MISLEKKRLRSDIIAAIKYLKGYYVADKTRVFVCLFVSSEDRTQANGFRLHQRRFQLNIRGREPS